MSEHDHVMSSDWRTELKKLKRSVRIAWFVNFAILMLTFEAGMIFAFLSTGATNEEILGLLMITLPVSAILSALVVAWVSWRSDKLVLGSVSGDMVQVESGHPVYNIVEEMCVSARLRNIPEVYVSRGTGVLNAFAVSDTKGNSRVVVTEELLQVLDRGELEGVLGHEVAHIVGGDSPDMTKLIALSSTVSIITGFVSRMFVNRNSGEKNLLAIALIVLSFIFLLVAPLLSALARSGMSRSRESRADALSVSYTMNPTGLASALKKIDNYSNQISKEKIKDFNKVGEMAIWSPSWLSMRTHPEMGKRLADLRAMGAQV